MLDSSSRSQRGSVFLKDTKSALTIGDNAMLRLIKFVD